MSMQKHLPSTNPPSNSSSPTNIHPPHLAPTLNHFTSQLPASDPLLHKQSNSLHTTKHVWHTSPLHVNHTKQRLTRMEQQKNVSLFVAGTALLKHGTPLPEIAATARPDEGNGQAKGARKKDEKLGSKSEAKPKCVLLLGTLAKAEQRQLAEYLAKVFQGECITTGEMLRSEVAKATSIGKEIQQFLDKKKPVPTSVLSLLFQKHVTSSTSCYFLQGFPCSKEQAVAWETQFGNAAPDAVITFGTSPVVEHYRAHPCFTSIPEDAPREFIEAVAYGSVQRFMNLKRPGMELHGKALVFVLGGPGSGKGTQCSKLKETFGLVHLSVGDLLRAEVQRHPESTLATYLREGQIVPVRTTLGLIQNALEEYAKDDGVGFLIDGFPRQLDQATVWEQELCSPDMVLYYDCPLTLLQERLLKRGETSGRSDDNMEAIQKRFKTFQEQSMPVVEMYRALGKLQTLSSDDTVESIFTRTKEVVSTLLKPIVFPNVVYVLGGPGSGKGTQCAILVEQLGFLHLSTGDLLRAEVQKKSEIGLKADAIMQQGGMVPMDIIRGLLLSAMRAHLASASGFLIDGYPRTLEQAKDIVLLAPPTHVLYFDCPEATLVQRLLERGKTSGRSDDNAESIQKRIQTFCKSTFPLVEFFENQHVLRKIDATRTVEDITSDTLMLFQAKSPNAPQQQL